MQWQVGGVTFRTVAPQRRRWAVQGVQYAAKAVRQWDETRVRRDREGQFADIAGRGDDAPSVPSQRRYATRADDGRRSQGQTRSNFVHPTTGHAMGKSEIGDTYEALFEAKAARMLVATYGEPPYRAIARAGGVGSRTTALDFMVDNRGGELKSLSLRSPNQKTAIKADEVARKRDAVAEAGVDPLLVVQVVDQDSGTVKVYAYEDFASKAVSRMTYLGDYSYSLADFEAAQRKTGHHDQAAQRAAAQRVR